MQSRPMLPRVVALVGILSSHFASAQLSSPITGKLSLCGNYCYGYSWGAESASTNCTLYDTKCICNVNSIISGFKTCEQGRCTQTEINNDFGGYVDVCNGYGITINLPSNGVSKGSSTSSSSSIPSLTGSALVTAATGQASNSSSGNSHSGLSAGAIVGIVIAALGIIAIFGALIFVIIVVNRRKRRRAAAAAPLGPAPPAGMAPQGPPPPMGPMAPGGIGEKSGYYGQYPQATATPPPPAQSPGVSTYQPTPPAYPSGMSNTSPVQTHGSPPNMGAYPPPAGAAQEVGGTQAAPRYELG